MDKLKAMTIFNAVVEEGSMTGAARRLGIANSAVSKNLNELEEWLGRKLIYRTTRNLRLSQEGHAYHEKIINIVHAVDRLEQTEELENDEIRGEVSITAPFIIGERLSRSFWPKFHHEYPNIKIKMILADDFVDVVSEGIDIAVRVSNLTDSNFIAKKIGVQTLRLVAAPSYIKKHGSPLTPELLNRHTCLIDSSVSDSKRWRFKSLTGGVKSVHIDGIFEINDAESIAQLCEAGVGIAQLPASFVSKRIQEGQLVELLPEIALEFDISILYHQKSTKSRIINSVISFLAENIEGHELV
ncbi:LysR family transcriptional regulator [Vibrio diabolicus]|uniref:LysR family transcriptional regulator n=1 Tax=Vibrio diabolicus TaxID=50719 RepID=UPI00215CA8EE|nr:LysR family transcriptional regulator [Vibrio diabolicus]MCR9303047.1 LysR family transcriptional regulator [Vibrio diabolicus]MCR9428464.1 LysR family transcriptional regulator [Vibrio diabolicus]